MAYAYKANRPLKVDGVLAFTAGDLVPATTANAYGWITNGYVDLVNVDDPPATTLAPYVPPGGTTGKVLKKNSSTDFDVSWGDGGAGGGVDLTVTDARYPRKADLTDAVAALDATKLNKTAAFKTINNTQPDANGNFNISTGLSVPNPVTLITGRAAPRAVICAQDQSAVYDATTKKTYLAFLGLDRALVVKEFDHVSLQWSDDTFVAAYQSAIGVEDDHGVPSMAIMPNGKLIVLFGSHITSPTIAISNVARSTTGGWSVSAGPAAMLGTYHCVAATSDAVWTLFRAGNATNSHPGTTSVPAAYPSDEWGVLMKSTDNGVTWGSPIKVVDTNAYNAPSVDRAKDFYLSGLRAANGKLHFCWAIAHGTGHDGTRSDCYGATFNPATSTLTPLASSTDLGAIIDDKTKLNACIVLAGDDNMGGRFIIEPDGTAVVATRGVAQDNKIAVWLCTKTPGDTDWKVRDTGARMHYQFADQHIARKVGGGYVLYIPTGRDEPTIRKSTGELLSSVGIGHDLTAFSTTDKGDTWTAVQVMSRYQTAGMGVGYVTCPTDAAPELTAIALPGAVSGGLSGGLPANRLPMYGISQTIANPLQILGAAAAGTRSTFYFNRKQFFNNATKPTGGAWQTIDLSGYTAFNATRVLLEIGWSGNGQAGRITMNFRQTGTLRENDAAFAKAATDTNITAQQVWVPLSQARKFDWQNGSGTGSTDPKIDALYMNIIAFETEGGGGGGVGAAYVRAAASLPIVTNPPVADTTAPTAPTSVAASPGAGSATLTPTGSTDAVGVTGYRAYSAQTGGSALATGATTVTVTGLTGGTAYTFWVSAYDAAGNESARTQSASVTPTAASTVPATAFVAPTGTAQPSFMVLGDQIVFSGSKVTGWKDYTGNLDSQVVSGKTAPDYDATAFGTNRPGASFVKASTMGLLWSKAMSGNGQTVLTLAKVASVNVGRMWWAGATADAEPSGAPIVYNNATAQVTTRLNGGAQTTTANTTGELLVANTAAIHRGSFSASTSRVVKSVLNGKTVVSTTTASSTATASSGLGVGAVGTDTNDIVIGALIVFDSELSESDAHAWTQALATYAGVTIGAN